MEQETKIELSDYEQGYFDCLQGKQLPTDSGDWDDSKIYYFRGWLDAKAKKIADER